MKKIESSSHFCVGGIYNIVYIGDNTAYAAINGRRTIRVTATDPKIKFVTLFDQFGNPLIEDIRSQEITAGTESFKEDEIFEPEDESEWFKKSARFSSLQEALKQELVTKEGIQRIANWCGTSPFIAHLTGLGHSLAGVTCSFYESDGRAPKQPLLQCVYIVWKNWKDLKTDFELLGIKPRT